jgi:hypothetical protein
MHEGDNQESDCRAIRTVGGLRSHEFPGSASLLAKEAGMAGPSAIAGFSAWIVVSRRSPEKEGLLALVAGEPGRTLELDAGFGQPAGPEQKIPLGHRQGASLRKAPACAISSTIFRRPLD